MPDPSGVDALYSVAPEEFIAARDTLAKELRAQGDRTAAQAVAKLRRPPVSAWALNQVARSEPALIADLLTAGASLRGAMANALSGDASDLRGAEATERSAVDAIVTTAASTADRSGRSLSEPHRQRMIATLRAAVLDDVVAASLQGGTLDADHEAPSFGFGSLPEGTQPAKRKETRGVPAKPKQTRGDAAKAARERARQAEIARVQAEVDRLERRAHRLEDEAAGAERRARELRAQADEAAVAAALARKRLADA